MSMRTCLTLVVAMRDAINAVNRYIMKPSAK